jgi:release factor glutamine methyltransferase
LPKPPDAPCPADARGALAWGAARIGGATARLDAELLLARHLGVAREALLLRGLDTAVDPAGFAALVRRRAAGEPVAYITGRKGFWTLDLIVTPDVLIPRPETETLIEAALALAARPPAAILDLGAGSGALLLAALSEWPAAWGLGVDRSAAALDVARANAAAAGLAPRAAFVRGDWGAALGGRFDLILANPPYVAAGDPIDPAVAAHEPAQALFAGADGLCAYRALLPDVARLLAPDGLAVLELGAGQAAAVARLAAAQGLTGGVRQDLAGEARALGLRHRAGDRSVFALAQAAGASR